MLLNNILDYVQSLHIGCMTKIKHAQEKKLN
jgi:hypothetical protein